MYHQPAATRRQAHRGWSASAWSRRTARLPMLPPAATRRPQVAGLAIGRRLPTATSPWHSQAHGFLLRGLGFLADQRRSQATSATATATATRPTTADRPRRPRIPE